MMLLSVSVHSSGMKSDANGGNSEKGEQQSDHLPSEKTTLQFHNVTVDQPPSFIPQLVNSQQDKNEPFLTRTTFGPQVILSKTSDVTVDQPPSFIPLLVNSQLDKNEPFLTRTTFGPQVLSSKISGQKTSVKRCLCLGPRLNIVRLQRVEKIEVFPASPLCDTLEIIVTLKNIGGKRCLNPESKFAQNYIKKSVEERSTQ
uniref:C-X-C motif chemokine n=1 Tax=Astyanax mexicanus TaxID=7994 RepID=A0A3B1JMN5_ASTMX